MPDGRVLVISNHAGQVALDAAMIGTATVLEREPPRIVRGMGEYWLPTVPFVNLLMSRTGSVVGTPKNCTDLLDNERGRHRLPGRHPRHEQAVQRALPAAALRLRLHAPGAGHPRADRARSPSSAPRSRRRRSPTCRASASLLGMPAFPITLTFPWLGPLGLLPLPVKYRIYFGKPMRFEGDPDDEDAVIDRKVQKVVEHDSGDARQGPARAARGSSSEAREDSATGKSGRSGSTGSAHWSLAFCLLS